MEEITRRWGRFVEELAVLDLRLSLEVDEARHELAGFVGTCRQVIDRTLTDWGERGSSGP